MPAAASSNFWAATAQGSSPETSVQPVNARRAGTGFWDRLLRPGEPGQPTEVLIRVYVVDITKILDVEQSFVTDVYFRAEWTDPRLVHDGPLPCQARPDQVWTPQVQSLNRRTLDSTSPPQIRIAPDGSAFFVVRRFGEFSYEADLGDFPFDEQTLSFVIVSAYEPQDVVLRSDEAAVGMAERLSVVNWNLNFREARSGALYVAPRDRTVARLDIEFSAKRLTGYYVWKLIVPLVLVVMMSWSVFWIAPVHVAPRLVLAATSMLTIIGVAIPPSYVHTLCRRNGAFCAQPQAGPTAT